MPRQSAKTRTTPNVARRGCLRVEHLMREQYDQGFGVLGLQLMPQHLTHNRRGVPVSPKRSHM